MTYTHGHHASVLRSHRWRTVDNSAAYLAPLLRPGQRLLDVGCGPGTITADFADRVAPGEVIGVDAATEAVAAADPDRSNLRFQVGSVYDLDFGDETFDVVHAHQVLQHLTDPVAALVEMRRVCAPDGVVAARDGDYRGMIWHPAEPALDAWMDLYQAVARANGGEPDAGRFLYGWALSAGFTEVVPSASAWCYATPTDRAWWADLWADRLTESAIGMQAQSLGLASGADLQDIADGWRRWATHDGGWFAVPHGEVICQP
ncbi:MAG: methyltransferase domain-containing protein [Acidimicrobiales bacterium]